jgi:hypothetical protein
LEQERKANTETPVYDNIGVLCVHKYSCHDIQPKGLDADVMRLLRSRGYGSVLMEPVMVQSSHAVQCQPRDHYVTDVDVQVFRMANEDLTRALLLLPPRPQTKKYVFVCPAASHVELLESRTIHDPEYDQKKVKEKYSSYAMFASREPNKQSILRVHCEIAVGLKDIWRKLRAVERDPRVVRFRSSHAMQDIVGDLSDLSRELETFPDVPGSGMWWEKHREVLRLEVETLWHRLNEEPQPQPEQVPEPEPEDEMENDGDVPPKKRCKV